ncbi:MAG: hypothetical protein H8E54_07975 [Candidatus Aminicenantes bacterium]|nr:hypothetical protein [Candidatus Aminicenantes bacterium]MBL7151793.1 hypothetical protein [Candidatus Omnitrophota bacterium]
MNKKQLIVVLGLGAYAVTPLIPILISLVSIVIGLFVFFRPDLIIEMQKKFYEKINWRIEPISMQKEIRNTKIMGAFLVIAAIITIIYSLMNTA